MPANDDLGRRIYATLMQNEHGLLTDEMVRDGWQMAARAHPDVVLRLAIAADLSMDAIDTSATGQILQVAAYASAQSQEKREQLLAMARGQKNRFAQFLAEGLQRPPEGAAEAKFPRDEVVLRRGETIYNNRCVACHGLDAQGVPGAFPPLAGSEWVTGDPSIPVRIVLHGLQGPVTVRGETYDSIMPPVVDLSEQDIADVLTYIRQSFGNDAEAVTLDQVKATRRANWRHPPWTIEELRAASK